MTKPISYIRDVFSCFRPVPNGSMLIVPPHEVPPFEKMAEPSFLNSPIQLGTDLTVNRSLIAFYDAFFARCGEAGFTRLDPRVLDGIKIYRDNRKSNYVDKSIALEDLNQGSTIGLSKGLYNAVTPVTTLVIDIQLMEGMRRVYQRNAIKAEGRAETIEYAFQERFHPQKFPLTDKNLFLILFQSVERVKKFEDGEYVINVSIGDKHYTDWISDPLKPTRWKRSSMKTFLQKVTQEDKRLFFFIIKKPSDPTLEAENYDSRMRLIIAQDSIEVGVPNRSQGSLLSLGSFEHFTSLISIT